MRKRSHTFSSVAESYLAQRVVSRVYESNVTRIAGRAGRLSAERLNAYLRERLEVVQASTVRSERTILLSLWRAAYESGLVDDPPRGVVRIKSRRPATKAWTIAQVREAVNKTEEYADKMLRSGANLGDFLRCWILLGYESGARRGDLWEMRGEHLDGEILRWTMSKTGDPLAKVLSAACLDACARMLRVSTDGRIIGWACGSRMGIRWMRKHLDACKIGGSSKWLRRSSATHIEIASPGRAKLHLGHRTPGLAERSYLDWGQIRANVPMAPALVEMGACHGVA